MSQWFESEGGKGYWLSGMQWIQNWHDILIIIIIIIKVCYVHTPFQISTHACMHVHTHAVKCTQTHTQPISRFYSSPELLIHKRYHSFPSWAHPQQNRCTRLGRQRETGQLIRPSTHHLSSVPWATIQTYHRPPQSKNTTRLSPLFVFECSIVPWRESV